MRAQRLDLNNLGSITLSKGDDDTRKIWGAQQRADLTGSPVRQLQEALISAGTLESADGHFGPGTELALIKFQWYRRNIAWRLRGGSISPMRTIAEGAKGRSDAATAADLLEWRAGGYVTTTPLVRLNVSELSNIRTAASFTLLPYPSAQHGEILVHADFADTLRTTVNDQARAANVHLHINQAFRSDDIPPSGTVVPPATKSQHLVGHAVDLNIVHDDRVMTASVFNAGGATPAALAFVDGAMRQGLRWGGKFAKADPVHFDDFLNPDGEDYDITHFFVQRCFRDRHPMRAV